jgi:hypothetical protein
MSRLAILLIQLMIDIVKRGDEENQPKEAKL